MRKKLLLATLIALAATACSANSNIDVADDDLQESYGPIEEETLVGKESKYAIVLAHGFHGAPAGRWGFYKVADALRKDGHTVYEAAVSPFGTPAQRARELAKTVDKALLHSAKVNIVAHSMGGIDARILVSELGYGSKVASLTTISTPHRGTAIADNALKLIREGKMEEVINALASTWGRQFTTKDLAEGSDVRNALVAISEASAPAFNRTHPNDARVFYQSWAGVSGRLGIGDDEDVTVCEGKLSGKTDVMDISLRAGSLLVGHGFGFQKSFMPNDGMSTVATSKWGTFRGCIRADHLDEVGQPKHDEPNQRTKFSHIRFFREMAFDLAKRGF